MIRFTNNPDGSVRGEVWFQLSSTPWRKITMDLEEYVALAKTMGTEAEMRREVFTRGKVTDITKQERYEAENAMLQLASIAPPSTMTA